MRTSSALVTVLTLTGRSRLIPLRAVIPVIAGLSEIGGQVVAARTRSRTQFGLDIVVNDLLQDLQGQAAVAQ